MKIVLDCVYTGKPSTCSTSYLMWQIIDNLCNWREDIQFYLLYPESVKDDEHEMEFLSKRPDRVQLIAIPSQIRNRMYELFTYSREMDKLLGCSCELWDTDMVITSRIPQIPNMRVNSGRNVGFGKGTFRQIIGLDEMPIFSFRKTVSWGSTGHLDQTTLGAYYMADHVIVNNLWTKKNLRNVARNLLAPTRARKVLDNVSEAVPVKLEPLQDNRKSWKKGEKFNIAFCGRVTGTRNIKEIIKLFTEQFVYQVGAHKDDVNFVFSTQSQSFGATTDIGDIDFIEIQHNDRAKFHKFLQEDAHLVVNLSTVEDFSLSTYEPLKFGVPVIVPDRDWADFLGETYPLRGGNHAQFYALINLFLKDYDKMYSLFREWHDDYWVSMCESEMNTTTADHVKSLITNWESGVSSKLNDDEYGGEFRKIANTILEETKEALSDPTDTVELDLASYWEDLGKITLHKDWAGIPVARRANLHVLKLMLLEGGFKDTNKTGVLTYGCDNQN